MQPLDKQTGQPLDNGLNNLATILYKKTVWESHWFRCSCNFKIKPQAPPRNSCTKCAISGRIRTAIINLARTRTAMRVKAYPGDHTATVELPEVVGKAIAELVSGEFETVTRIVLEG